MPASVRTQANELSDPPGRRMNWHRCPGRQLGNRRRISLKRQMDGQELLSLVYLLENLKLTLVVSNRIFFHLKNNMYNRCSQYMFK